MITDAIKIINCLDHVDGVNSFESAFLSYVVSSELKIIYANPENVIEIRGFIRAANPA